MCGKATLTIDVSSNSSTVPSITDSAISHRYGLGSACGTSIGFAVATPKFSLPFPSPYPSGRAKNKGSVNVAPRGCRFCNTRPRHRMESVRESQPSKPYRRTSVQTWIE
jgi:hypothetical protein